MFGLFGSRAFEDSCVGQLTRSGGCWKGTMALGRYGTVGLRLSGGRDAPDPAGLALARELPDRFGALGCR
jgi:hypothetical protein